MGDVGVSVSDANWLPFPFPFCGRRPLYSPRRSRRGRLRKGLREGDTLHAARSCRPSPLFRTQPLVEMPAATSYASDLHRHKRRFTPGSPL